MIAVIGSLIIGVIIGFFGQKSRICFIGGVRDLLIVRDKELLKGVISFFASAWITIWILFFIGKIIPNYFDVLNVKKVIYPSFISAVLSKFGLISFIGGIGLGLFSTLSGGCPLRQHVLAGQGRIDSMMYLLGFYFGIIVYYLSLVKILSKLF